LREISKSEHIALETLQFHPIPRPWDDNNATLFCQLFIWPLGLTSWSPSTVTKSSVDVLSGAADVIGKIYISENRITAAGIQVRDKLIIGSKINRLSD